MARRSDFAQKLLDDLRLRKQKMASAQTHTAPTDLQQHLRSPYKGSTTTDIRNQNGNLTGRPIARQFMGEASKEIVPSHGSQRSKYTIDLPMAFAMALENYGRYGTLEFSGNQSVRKVLSTGWAPSTFIVSNENNRAARIGLPALSHVRINEISKGAQKLHQILQACSKGLNYDRYSIDMGRELLKGAIDLEESLRMLIDMQAASEYVVHSQKKKIQLLDDDEENDDTEDMVKNMQMLARPRFSYDASSRKPPGSGLHKQNPTVPTPRQANTDNEQYNQKKGAKKIHHVPSHGRSASEGTSFSVHTFSGTPKESTSQKITSNSSTATISPQNKTKEDKYLVSEKRKKRIPNVIAKLMGLEELPPNKEPKIHGAEIVGNTIAGSNLNQNNRQKIRPANLKDGNSVRANSKDLGSQQMKVLQARKRIPSQYSATEVTVGEGKQKLNSQNRENVDPVAKTEGIFGFDGPTTAQQTHGQTVAKHPIHEAGNIGGKQKPNELGGIETMISSTTQCSRKPTSLVTSSPYVTQVDPNKSSGLPKQDLQVGQPHSYFKDHKRQGDQTLRASREVAQGFDRPEKTMPQHDSSASVNGQEPTRNKKFQEGQRDFKDETMVPSSQEGTISGTQPPEPSFTQKPHQTKHKETGVQTEKNKLKMEGMKKSEKMPKNVIESAHRMNPKKKLQQKTLNTSSTETSNGKIQATSNKENMIYLHLEFITENSANWSSEEQRFHNSELSQEIRMDAILSTEKPKQQQVTQENRDYKAASRIERPQKKEAGRKTKGDYEDIKMKPEKEGIPLLQEQKQRRDETVSKVIEAIPDMPISRSLEQKQQIQSAHSSSLLNAGGILSRLKHTETARKTYKTTSTGEKTRDVLAVQQSSITCFDDDQIILLPREIEGKGPHYHHKYGGSTHTKLQKETVSRSHRQQPLTGEENKLKQALVKSQQFLTAAVAFFRLHVPVSVLHASYHIEEDKDSKAILDCGYEIMKRKSRRDELAFHPTVKMPIVLAKVRTLDDLVKELNKEISHLRKFKEPQGEDNDLARCLHKMLERDIGNRNPDANCMWDLGWNYVTFAYVESEEVIKDVEKSLFNRLLDEITGDLLQTSMTKKGSI